MVVASGQMPYDYGTPLPIRALPNAWPGIGVPNISASGNIIEAAMFVYNAELRKWNVDELSLLTYLIYSHPDIAPSGFEPKANGETLTGLVGGISSLISIDNIEHLRLQLSTYLLDAYASDSVYTKEDFLEAWLKTAYPQSPSGGIVIYAIIPNAIYLLDGRTFLRPPAEHVINGNFVDTDIHWLGGSGVFFDIDHGEVIFNPFPFPREGFNSAPSTSNFLLAYSPVTPLCQTTAGTIPSLVVSRYESDLTAGSFPSNTNFQALGSGYVQIDGYVLLPSSVMELVKGNDTNFEPTVVFSNHYTGHIQGLRRVNEDTGQNDPSARCYRLPSPKASGLYRLLTHNPKSLVPQTAIPSGFVSLWPQGQVVMASDGAMIQSNFIDGQQLTANGDGTFSLSAAQARGIHVFDDAIWLAGKNTSSRPAIADVTSRGLFCVSPFTGSFVWYTPAEMTVASSGNNNSGGSGPGAFATHVGLIELDDDYVRMSLTFNEALTLNASPAADTGVYDFYWQRYNKQTLEHVEQNSQFTIIEDGLPSFTNIRGAIRAGTAIYTWIEFSRVHEWDTSLNYVASYIGSPGVAGRRHYAGGDLLYTLTGNAGVGDPLLSIVGGATSGIGKWSISGSNFTHDSAKPLRAEHHFGHRDRALIHSIFDVTGSTHVRDGIWMTICFPASAGAVITSDQLFLCRIEEKSTEWLVLESLFTGQFVESKGFVGLVGFPTEGVLRNLS